MDNYDESLISSEQSSMTLETSDLSEATRFEDVCGLLKMSTRIDELNEKVQTLIEEHSKMMKTIEEKFEEWKPQIKETVERNIRKTEATKLREQAVTDNVKTPLKTPEQPTTSMKKFVVKHVFKNVSGMEEDKYYYSGDEEHFGLLWYITIEKKEKYLSVYLQNRYISKKKWSIETDFDIHVIHPAGSASFHLAGFHCFETNGGIGFANFMESETMKKEYLINDELTVEIRVKVNKTTGIYPDDLRCFNDKECSDVALVVNNRKFYVLKLFLATHSSYFKTLFLGKFNESEQTEVLLSGVDSADLQKFLEALYGDLVIDGN